jgi:predicted negative regulator of RcsB-dependent stress response
MSNNGMITKKHWEEFQETGLFLLINSFLHVFGWAIVYEWEDGQIKQVYPARMKYRGFDTNVQAEAHKMIAKYMAENITELKKEADED